MDDNSVNASPPSLIKGLFVKAHIDRIKKEYPPEILATIEKHYGQPLDFRSFREYDIKDENRFLQCCIKAIMPTVGGDDIDFEAGRFHWQTFFQTMVMKTAVAMTSGDVKNIWQSPTGLCGRFLPEYGVNMLKKDRRQFSGRSVTAIIPPDILRVF